MKSLIATALALSTGVLASSSTCPFNYPAEINTTDSGNGLVWTIASTNPVTNNRAIQLRTNPNIDGAFYVGLDASSSVLLGNLADGAIKSQARDEYNQLYDLGPTGYLSERTEINGTTEYIFGFANATVVGAGGTTKQVDTNWTMIAPDNTGTYGLYHDEGDGVVNGFILCEADFDTAPGPWYVLLYYVYESEPANLPGCEFVGVRSTVAPDILNGECEIAGYTA
ncbi:hypothetical protein F5Y16DRAFT_371268 [Xylariaceae sp. FL0255]|nr:hypothetical protein F5Y16DRAFT_371268 [Xylariaceae sp. FL0255]